MPIELTEQEEKFILALREIKRNDPTRSALSNTRSNNKHMTSEEYSYYTIELNTLLRGVRFGTLSIEEINDRLNKIRSRSFQHGTV